MRLGVSSLPSGGDGLGLAAARRRPFTYREENRIEIFTFCPKYYGPCALCCNFGATFWMAPKLVADQICSRLHKV